MRIKTNKKNAQKFEILESIHQKTVIFALRVKGR